MVLSYVSQVSFIVYHHSYCTRFFLRRVRAPRLPPRRRSGLGPAGVWRNAVSVSSDIAATTPTACEASEAWEA